MRKFKSVISIILTLALAFTMVNFTTVNADSYENWKQYDSQWADFRLGSGSGTTMKKIGCRVTAIAIVCAKLGLVDSDFNPGTFASDLKSMGAFTSSGAMYNWTDPEKLVDGLQMVKKVSLSGTQAEKAAIIAQYTTNGYACTIAVKNGGHYVAANYVSGSTVYMHNPGSKKTDLFATYANSGITSIRVFKSTKTSATITKPTSTQPQISKPTINVTQYPTTINQGSSFGLRGAISSSNKITSVKGYVINSSNSTVLSSSDSPNSSSMDIRYANLNQKMSFGNLSAGTYTLKVVATDSSGGSTTWSKSFTVKGQATSTTHRPTLSVTSYPTSINKGASFGMRGSVVSNGATTTVRTTVTNSSGKTVLSASDTVGANSTGNIRYMNVNNKLTFGSLAKGTYTLKIVASNSAGTSTFSTSFTVK